jgi:hypothetical protein
VMSSDFTWETEEKEKTGA